ncbi:MAG: T9SS type A sorting domain-containing protein [Saprospiraceae bacterium]|nr:T9SS type A sorting domain-containing protein [Saprospiraceae bacterium]
MTKFLKALSIFVILTLGAPQVKAQFVTIPDTNFVNWLNSHGFSSCLNGNQMDTTCNLVVNAVNLSCSSSNINDLTGIAYFDSLDTLQCNNNLLTSISSLPGSLKVLICEYNDLTSLPVLPTSLKILRCEGNNILTLPSLPSSLEYLQCRFNQITVLPPLPSFLKKLECSDNFITSMPALPSGLEVLYCFNNQLTSLPALNSTLIDLGCSYNQLTSLPILPDSLYYLYCSHNFLDSLPELPDSLVVLNASDNLLTSLPELKAIQMLVISNNVGITCLPPIRELFEFHWLNTSINCFPNRIAVTFDIPSILGIPICDLINSNGCQSYWNIRGKVFSEQNINCILDSNELVVANVKLNLYDNGNLVQQTYVNSLGQYSFDADFGNYTYNIDTMGVPFIFACPSSFSYTSVVNFSNLFHENKDFSFNCIPGFDVGALSISRDSGIFRPTNYAVVTLSAGDMASPYNLICTSVASGLVKVIINGPATFINAAPGSLIPIVNGDTLLYSIPDFGAVNFYNDFLFIVQTDTLAQLNDQVCFNVLVTPVAGDNNSANNYYTHCFTVVNSYDPNDKQVSPSGLTDTSLYDLTYTVRFQNTGNAPAQHIYVLDTLDQNIDESSFQLLAYSHEPQMQIIGKRVRFNFPNINLPDSVNNEPESHGFVQYRVKRKNNLSIGTQIHNTAYIYFDFNAPVQTNTTTNEIAVTSGVGLGEYDNPILFSIFPNPIASGQMLNIYFNSSEKKKAELSVYDLSGRKLFTQFVNASEQSQVVALPNIYAGVYLVVLNDGKHQAQQKLVVLKNGN